MLPAHFILTLVVRSDFVSLSFHSLFLAIYFIAFFSENGGDLLQVKIFGQQSSELTPLTYPDITARKAFR